MEQTATYRNSAPDRTSDLHPCGRSRLWGEAQCCQDLATSLVLDIRSNCFGTMGPLRLSQVMLILVHGL